MLGVRPFSVEEPDTGVLEWRCCATYYFGLFFEKRAQAHTNPSSILVDKHDFTGLDCHLDFGGVFSSAQIAICGLKARYGWLRNTRMTSQLRLRPTAQCSRHFDLTWLIVTNFDLLQFDIIYVEGVHQINIFSINLFRDLAQPALYTQRKCKWLLPLVHINAIFGSDARKSGAV
jgi:hypothetical protein